MRLLSSRALALIGLLMLPALLTPREGAALTPVHNGDKPPVILLGDPDIPSGSGSFNFYWRATLVGRVELSVRFAERIGLVRATRVATTSAMNGGCAGRRAER
jgi:hypothetical protein